MPSAHFSASKKHLPKIVRAATGCVARAFAVAAPGSPNVDLGNALSVGAFSFAMFPPFLCRIFLNPPPDARISHSGERAVQYQIDLDPKHSVIRLTVMEDDVSLECAEDVYKHLSQLRG